MSFKKHVAALTGFAFIILLIASCQKELSFEGSGLLPGGGTGGTGGGTGTAVRRCVACTYLPFCDSSEFVYLLNGTDTAGGLIHVLNDTTVNGQTFTKVSGFAALGGSNLLYNCASQEYKLALPLSQFGINTDSLRAALTPLLDSLLPFPVDPASIYLPATFYATVLKANSATGSTWLDTLTAFTMPVSVGPITLNVRLYVGIEYTYLQKDITRTVLTRNFTLVQHVQGKPKVGITSQLPIPLPLPLPAINGQIDFYMAKDVGLVEMNASDSTGVLTSAKLIRYRL